MTKYVSKALCITFVSHVLRKAIAAVDAKYEPQIKEAMVTYLKENNMHEDIVEIQKAIDNMVHVLSKFRGLIDKATLVPISWGSNRLLDILSHASCTVSTDEGKQERLPIDVLEHITKIYTFKNNEVYKKYKTEQSEIHTNYSAIIRNIESMASGSKAYAYLKELGFDVTWLDERSNQKGAIMEVDKSKLFPCGETK